MKIIIFFNVPYIYIYRYMANFLTTVKLNEEIYIRFKEINVRDKISFQEFVNKCIESYVENEEFRNELSESIVSKRPITKKINIALNEKNESLLNQEFELSKSNREF